MFNDTIDFVGSGRFVQEARAHLVDYRSKFSKFQDFDTNSLSNAAFVSEFEFGVGNKLRCMFSNLNFILFCIFMFSDSKNFRFAICRFYLILCSCPVAF